VRRGAYGLKVYSEPENYYLVTTLVTGLVVLFNLQLFSIKACVLIKLRPDVMQPHWSILKELSIRNAP